MDLFIQISKKIRFFINPVVSVFCIEMPYMNFIGIISDYDHKTHADDVEYSEFQIIIS